MKRETQLVHFDRCPGDPYLPASAPIYQTATFEQPDPERFALYDYSRTGNPTRRVLENQLAALEEGTRSLAFASGMAAISAVARLAGPGRRIVLGSDLYGGTHRLFGRIVSGLGVEVVAADTSDLKAASRAITPGTALVLIETPSNPLHRVSDIAAVAELAHGTGALLAVDGTMMSPYLQRPLAFGADIAIQSATKFLGGHADLTAGTVTVRDDELAGRIAFIQNAEGSALGPFDSWLLVRSIRTLGVRIERQQRSAAKVAGYLNGHRRVRRLLWIGLTDHAGREVHERQADGPGSVITFEADSLETARRVASETKLFTTSVSFGSVGSSISLPARMSHASVPAELAGTAELTPALVRISIGLEDPGDLIEDLDRALG